MKTPHLTFPSDVADKLRQAYQRASVILEYGSGGSTVLAAKLPGKSIYTVESDPQWAIKLMEYITAERLPSVPIIHFADIGPTREWGNPVDEKSWKKWSKYATSIWSEHSPLSPDVVLVDGRFRVACFLASACSIKKPVEIFFDDYIDRTHYHVVEAIVQPYTMIGRMAIFRVEPGAVKAEDLLRHVDKFYDYG